MAEVRSRIDNGDTFKDAPAHSPPRTKAILALRAAKREREKQRSKKARRS